MTQAQPKEIIGVGQLGQVARPRLLKFQIKPLAQPPRRLVTEGMEPLLRLPELRRVSQKAQTCSARSGLSTKRIFNVLFIVTAPLRVITVYYSVFFLYVKRVRDDDDCFF